MQKRQGFYLYHEDIEILRNLTYEQKGMLLDALYNFSVNGERLETDNVAIGIAFGMMAAKIARDAEKYEKKCEKNRRNILQRYERIQSNTTVNDRIRSLPTVTVPVTVNETVTATATETVTETVPVTATETATTQQNGCCVVNNVVQIPFTPPTLDEVAEYCDARNSSVDPLRFFTYYAGRGWMMGRTPMRDWHAAVQWWEQRDEAENTQVKMRQDNEPVRWID